MVHVSRHTQINGNKYETHLLQKKTEQKKAKMAKSHNLHKKTNTNHKEKSPPPNNVLMSKNVICKLWYVKL